MIVKQPIGLDSVCDRITQICDNAKMYRHCGIKPPHMTVNLDPGNGRTTLLEYMVKKFEESKVIDFSKAFDKYIEISFDGSLQQLKNAFSVIKTSAVTDNCFKYIIGMDVSALVPRMHEAPCTEFFKAIPEVCKHATVIFFLPSAITKNDESFIDKLNSVVNRLEYIKITPYTATELALIAVQKLSEYGFKLDESDKFIDLLERIMCNDTTISLKHCLSLLEEIILYADYSITPPVLKSDMLTKFGAFKTKGENAQCEVNAGLKKKK